LDLTPYYEKDKKYIYPDEMSSNDLIKKIKIIKIDLKNLLYYKIE
jgi:hypothetical protein